MEVTFIKVLLMFLIAFLPTCIAGLVQRCGTVQLLSLR